MFIYRHSQADANNLATTRCTHGRDNADEQVDWHIAALVPGGALKRTPTLDAGARGCAEADPYRSRSTSTRRGPRRPVTAVVWAGGSHSNATF
jgi:hypothetical protein